MSVLYSDPHRELQDRFDTRRMADLLEGAIVHAEFADDEKAFIEQRDMFFLSTIDPSGRPTVSYKGGAPGFVRVTGPSTLLFPCYDGNGMYYSVGNLTVSPDVGMLFIDFETPHRLRVHGKAEVCLEHPELGHYPGAEFLVSVQVERIWVNCARYIHQYRRSAISRYAPEIGKDVPFATWKRVDLVQEALPDQDKSKVVEAGGQITVETYLDRLGRGET